MSSDGHVLDLSKILGLIDVSSSIEKGIKKILKDDEAKSDLIDIFSSIFKPVEELVEDEEGQEVIIQKNSPGMDLLKGILADDDVKKSLIEVGKGIVSAVKEDVVDEKTKGDLVGIGKTIVKEVLTDGENLKAAASFVSLLFKSQDFANAMETCIDNLGAQIGKHLNSNDFGAQITKAAEKGIGTLTDTIHGTIAEGFENMGDIQLAGNLNLVRVAKKEG